MGDEEVEIFQQLINNNSGSVEKLELGWMTFTNEVTFNEMMNMTEICLIGCRGNTGLQSLLSRASNLKRVILDIDAIDAATAATFGNMKNLEELVLSSCRGEISTLLSRASNLKKVKLTCLVIDAATAATIGNMMNLEELQLTYCRGEISTLLKAVAPNVSSLVLKWIDENIAVEVPFPKLTKLKLQGCRGEMSSVLTQAAPYITSLDLGDIDMNTLVNKPFTNLRVLVRRELIPGEYCCKDIDISDSPLLNRGGRLEEFGSKVKRTWNEDASDLELILN